MKTGTASLPAGESAQVDFSFTFKPIVLVLSAGLLLRLVLAAFPGFEGDLGTFQAWSRDLAAHWPWNFYHSGSFSDWTPGYLYILWLFGLFDKVFTLDAGQFEYLLKLPPVAADLASVYLLYVLLEGQKPAVRLGAATVYALFPALLIVGPVWAQVDSVPALFLLLTVYCLVRGRTVLGTVVYVIGFLTKPQMVAALPFLAFWVLRDQSLQALGDLPAISDPAQRALWVLGGLAERLWRPVLAALAAGLLIILPFFLPFVSENPPWGIFAQMRDATEVYPYSTFFAYNFWGMLWTQSSQFPQFPRDDLTYWGLEYRTWGILLFAISILAVMVVFQRARSPGLVALATALSVMAFFVFLTRMHERYLFPFFLPFLAACVLTRSRALWASFGVLGAIHFFNLYNVYIAYNLNPGGSPNPLKWDWLFHWSGGDLPFMSPNDGIFLFSLLTFLAFPALLLVSVLLCRREREEPEPA